MTLEVATAAMGETHRLWGQQAKCGAREANGLKPLVSTDPEAVTCARCLKIREPGDMPEQRPLPLV